MEQNKNKIDVDKIDLEKEQEKSAENPGIIAFPHNIGSVVIKPEDKGKIKGRAMAAMKDQTERQMNQLYEQMRTLAAQANSIKRRVDISERIYLSQINFEPIINHIYYLYEKKNGDNILSMVSPVEWGPKMPYQQYLAAVKLLSDHTWEVLEDKNQFFDHNGEDNKEQ